MMISSAEEFVNLRQSDKPEDYLRAATEAASIETWFDVMQRFPTMKRWVAHNKTVPLRVLSVLAKDPDPQVRCQVALKNKLSAELFDLLAADSDDSVRERIAYNKNVPHDVLARLANDSCERISQQAEKRLAADD